MKKSTVIFVIDSLGRGGAEMLLIGLLPEYQKHFEVVLVNLIDRTEFLPEEIKVDHRYILNFNSNIKLPLVAMKLRSIIKKHNPVLVRSDLYWSTIVARLATPSSIPLLSIIHNTLSNDAFNKNRKSLYLERMTTEISDLMVAVSETVVEDYLKFVKRKKKTIVLHNFVSDQFFNQQYRTNSIGNGKLHIACIGNLKPTKNHKFLLEVFKDSTINKHFSLDIFGEGPLREDLQDVINQHNLSVNLKGLSDNLHLELPKYDLYIMSSLYEGLPVSTMEAMAVGVPLILNDIDVMKEVSGGSAYYYKSGDVQSCIQELSNILQNSSALYEQSRKMKNLARMHYSQAKFANEMIGIMKNAM